MIFGNVVKSLARIHDKDQLRAMLHHILTLLPSLEDTVSASDILHVLQLCLGTTSVNIAWNLYLNFKARLNYDYDFMDCMLRNLSYFDLNAKKWNDSVEQQIQFVEQKLWIFYRFAFLSWDRGRLLPSNWMENLDDVMEEQISLLPIRENHLRDLWSLSRQVISILSYDSHPRNQCHINSSYKDGIISKNSFQRDCQPSP